MPRAITPPSSIRPTHITKLTNCRLVKGSKLVNQDLWISSLTGKILRSQQAFYSDLAVPDHVVDLGGRIVSPGLIDVQLNGAFGVNFSTVPDDMSRHAKTLRDVNISLLKTGVTSYLPTLTSQKPELLPYLAPTTTRLPLSGSQSLGAHCEGPFLSPTKNGIHTPSVLLTPTSYNTLETCYGASSLSATTTIHPDGTTTTTPPAIKLITAAPELGNMLSLIPALREKDILFSIGHTEATYELAASAVAAGATMLTHLFNQMRPLHHRNPGPFGVLGASPSSEQLGRHERPFFGIICDGIHLHGTSVRIAYSSHPEGCVLVTDAMEWVGMPDGVYEWTNGERIVKRGTRLTLAPREMVEGGRGLSIGSSDGCNGSENEIAEKEGKIAGSAIDLVGCVNNFLRWTGASVAQALGAVTATPARMLGLEGVKGSLEEEADADLVVFSENGTGQGEESSVLVVDQVWKFGVKMFDREEGME